MKVVRSDDIAAENERTRPDTEHHKPVRCTWPRGCTTQQDDDVQEWLPIKLRPGTVMASHEAFAYRTSLRYW